MKLTALLLALVLSSTCYAQLASPTTQGQPPQTSPVPKQFLRPQNPSQDRESVVKKNIAECDGGNVDSCLILVQGFMEEDNTDEAYKYAQKGCNMNSGIACGVIGILIVSTNAEQAKNMKDAKAALTKACKYFEKGCKLEDATSCKTLADIYKSELVKGGTPKKIIDLYTKSCGIGLQSACAALDNYKAQHQGALSNSKPKSK